jgi:5-methylcytosine-specific restriction endonuclease McrA
LYESAATLDFDSRASSWCPWLPDGRDPERTVRRSDGRKLNERPADDRRRLEPDQARQHHLGRGARRGARLHTRRAPRPAQQSGRLLQRTDEDGDLLGRLPHKLGPASDHRREDQVEQEYGLAPKGYGKTLEIDHIVSLELGGSNEIANLYPEEATFSDSSPGYHVKDKLENQLHDMVCNGEISLSLARKQIAADWEKVYAKVFGTAPTG